MAAGGLKALVPVPVRALPWRTRWLSGTDEFAAAPVRTVLRFVGWSVHELFGGEFEFATSDGTRFVTMPNCFAALKVYISSVNDPAIERAMSRHLRAGDVAVDVGANIGTYAVRMARAVGAGGRVIAIEAHPDIHALLARNIAANGLGNVAAHNLAAGAAEGRVAMVYVAENPGESHIGAEAGEIPLRRLDDVLAAEGVGAVDYLKIDVEGYELLVLEGARETLTASPRAIVQTELVDRHARRYGRSAEETAAFLAELGFAPHCAEADGSLRPVGAAQAVEMGEALWARAR